LYQQHDQKSKRGKKIPPVGFTVAPENPAKETKEHRVSGNKRYSIKKWKRRWNDKNEEGPKEQQKEDEMLFGDGEGRWKKNQMFESVLKPTKTVNKIKNLLKGTAHQNSSCAKRNNKFLCIQGQKKSED